MSRQVDFLWGGRANAGYATVEERCSYANADPAFAEVGVFVDERRPVDELHGGIGRDRVSGRHVGAYRVRVDPADRQDGDAAAEALRVGRLGRQRLVAADVVGAGVARVEAEAEDATQFQTVVVDRARVQPVRQPVDRRLVLLATRHTAVDGLARSAI